MVCLSQPILDSLGQMTTCKPISDNLTVEIPVVNLSKGNAKNLIVSACKEFGFFKVINGGVSIELLNKLEAEAFNFFKLNQQEKEKYGPPNPFGYGNKKIGPNGDEGWVEYLLICTKSNISNDSLNAILPENLRFVVKEYLLAIRNMTCKVLDMISEELKILPRDTLSRMIRDDESDCCFRLNHYPPCPEKSNRNNNNLIGFGAHTDPQIISVARSNGTSGLQICLKDGTWISVPPDETSFFFNVGDSLQVMTNGRFRSVRHRVLTHSSKSRVSMIFFGGPPLDEKLKSLSSLMEENEESLYKEFTWSEYKKSAYKTRLGDNRLSLFHKSAQ